MPGRATNAVLEHAPAEDAKHTPAARATATGERRKGPRARRKSAGAAPGEARVTADIAAGAEDDAGTAKRPAVKRATPRPAATGAPSAASVEPPRAAAAPEVGGEDQDERPTDKQPRVRVKKTGGPTGIARVSKSASEGLSEAAGDAATGKRSTVLAADLPDVPPPGAPLSLAVSAAEAADAEDGAAEDIAAEGIAVEAAVPAEGETDGGERVGAPPSRGLVKARPTTRKEAALVARTSRKLATAEQAGALAVLPPAITTPTILPAPKRPAHVTGMPVFAPSRPRGVKRNRIGGIVVAVVTTLVLIGALQSVRPFGGIRGHDQSMAPNGALLAIDPVSNTPTGPWDTAAGTGEALGLGGGAGPNVSAPGSAGLPVSGGGGGNEGIFKASPGQVFISSPPIAPWPPDDPFMEVPNHPAFGVRRPGDGYYWWAFGQCTWWAQYERRDQNLTYLGDARDWAYGAYDRGYRVGVLPAPGSTVVFRPGAQGAGGAGHVAHVEAVYPGGWFLISEMNFYWNGGGWGRVDYRFAHTGWGVAFIY